MKKLSALSLALSVSGAVSGAVAGCAKDGGVSAAAPSASEQAIINGAACSEDVEPTAVAIMLDATVTFDGQGSFDLTQVMCTGTLIAPDVVLLAAHCVDTSTLTFGFGTVDRADFYVTFEADLSAFAEHQGDVPLPIPASAIPVKSLVAHPEFDINSLGEGTSGRESDIALLFLEVAVDGVTPEAVITKEEGTQLKVGDAVTIAGWGQQTQTSGPFEPPPPGSVGIKHCGASTLDELGTTLMQIGADAAAIRKCHGDSGGPTYIEIQTSTTTKRRVIGVTSRAYDQRDCALGGVDTRVDAFFDFIDAEMTARCEEGGRVWCDVPGVVPADFFVGGGDEGEGEGNEGEGEGRGGDGEEEEEDGPGGPFGCAAAPVDAGFAAGLVLLFARRRRRH